MAAALLALRQARLLVKNGLGMEAFLDQVIAAAASPGLRVIDSSQRAAQQVRTIRDGLIAPYFAQRYGLKAESLGGSDRAAQPAAGPAQ